MIEKLYFNSFSERVLYGNYVHKIPYIIYIKSDVLNIGNNIIHYCIGQRSLLYSSIYIKTLSKEEWFNELSSKDKQEAIWLMHD